MVTVNNAPLGIVACPGGENFARQILTHLKNNSLLRFNRKCAALAKAYGFSEQEAIRQINLKEDLLNPRIEPTGDIEAYREPNYEIKAKFTRFANGEIKTELLTSVRQRDIYIVQDVYSKNCGPYFGADEKSYTVNDHYVTLLTAIDAAIGASPASITCILPAYPYARQHKKKGREGLTAALVGRILENMGVHRIVTLDIHSKAIDHTFQTLRLENLHGSYQIIKALTEIIDINSEDLVVLAPDTGAVDRNKYYANSFGCPLAMLYKERDYSKVTLNAGETNIKGARLLGEVRGKTVFLADDMLGTGGTLIKALQEMKEAGAQKVIIAISLPLFTGDAVERFEEAYRQGLFYRMIGANAVSHTNHLLKRPWYTSADVSKLFSETIDRLHNNRSLSPILDNNEIIQKLLSEARKKD